MSMFDFYESVPNFKVDVLLIRFSAVSPIKFAVLIR